VNKVQDNWRVFIFLHLEHADTGLETRNSGLSEKLDLGISSSTAAWYVGCGAE